MFWYNWLNPFKLSAPTLTLKFDVISDCPISYWSLVVWIASKLVVFFIVAVLVQSSAEQSKEQPNIDDMTFTLNRCQDM